jgi:hypothetical protein
MLKAMKLVDSEAHATPSPRRERFASGTSKKKKKNCLGGAAFHEEIKHIDEDSNLPTKTAAVHTKEQRRPDTRLRGTPNENQY